LKSELAKNVTSAQYAYTLTDVNGGTNPGTKFNKLILKSVAYIKAQEHSSRATTKFTFGVDKDSDNVTIKNLVLFTKNNKPLNTAISTVEEGSTIQLSNEESVQFIEAIGWGETSNVLVPEVLEEKAIITVTVPQLGADVSGTKDIDGVTYSAAGAKDDTKIVLTQQGTVTAAIAANSITLAQITAL
jgi:hypothetical protein